MFIKRILIFGIFCFICIATIFPLPAQENLPAIVKKIEPSTVVVLCFDKQEEIIGQGSGFFIDNKGDVITNYHVLEGVSDVKIKTTEGKIYPVTTVIGEDKVGDLIRLSANIHPDIAKPLSVSTSLPEIGERIVVIGNPLGFEQTVSDGIISAVREIPGFGKILQITAPISEGSSGSPVVNMHGEVIGIATFKVIEGQSLNFAIPCERIERLTPTKKQALAEREEQLKQPQLVAAEDLYNKGSDLLLIGNYEKAIYYFEKAIKKNPNKWEIYNFLGLCNRALGRYDEAIKAFKETLRIDPEDDVAYSELGLLYFELGRYDEAIRALKEAIRINPDSFAYIHYNHSYLGASYLKLGQFNEAIKAYKQAIRLDPNEARNHYALGINYSQVGRYNEAIKAYKQAILLEPNMPETHYNLAVAYLILGDEGSAWQEYKILKDLDEKWANDLFNQIYR